MDWKRSRLGRNRNVFKGCVLVSTLLERHPQKFKSRAAAAKFAKRLFRDGIIKSIFNANSFEDSAQLYMWQDEEIARGWQVVTSRSSSLPPNYQSRFYGLDFKLIDDVRTKILNRADNLSLINNFFKELEKDFPEHDFKRSSNHHLHNRYLPPSAQNHYQGNHQRSNTESTDQSLDIGRSNRHSRDRSPRHHYHYYRSAPSRLKNYHRAIMEERDNNNDIDQAEVISIDYEAISSAQPSRVSSATGSMDQATQRWNDTGYSYSDNEKQLIEEMKRMKKEHQHVLRSYEDRINKLMAKMHELRSIAEMLENSSTKSSPYGILPAKAGLLSLIGNKLDQERRHATSYINKDLHHRGPPPLPPRPGRGNKVYPNKPIIRPKVKLQPLEWKRLIITDEDSDGSQATVWQSMMEPRVDGEDLERLFQDKSGNSTKNFSLYEDLYIRRGKHHNQLSSVLDVEKSSRVINYMKKLHCTLSDFVNVLSSLDPPTHLEENLIDLLDLMSSSKDMEKILHFVKRKGTGALDTPEFLIFELSKIPHFKERMEFLRFRYKLLLNLFEIDQQLKELHTACDEVTNCLSLKNLLETLLALGNYLNGNTELGQADGFSIEILNTLKEKQDRFGRSHLLEYVLRSYCHLYEMDLEIGCPTRFRLPEPSNMRHAAQVSFDDIHNALNNLKAELHHVEQKVDVVMNLDGNTKTNGLKTTLDNFFSSALVMLESKEKLLKETREYFKRTCDYFIFGNGSVTSPQTFFHVWATFLHDCKYYWKVAHRKLARDRFDLEFKTKGQESSSCIPHKKEQENLNSFLAPPNNLKHVDTWVQSLQNYQDTQPKPSHLTSNPEPRISSEPLPSEERSHSPKRIMSSPPSSSNVHKPTPRNSHSQDTHSNKASSQHVLDDYANIETNVASSEQVRNSDVAQQSSVPLSNVTPSHNSAKHNEQMDQQRKERGVGDRHVENTPSSPQKHQFKNPLQKLRNTFGRFTTGHHSRRNMDSVGKNHLPSDSHQHANRDSENRYIQPDMQQQISLHPQVASSQSYKEYQGPQMCEPIRSNHVGKDHQDNTLEAYISENKEYVANSHDKYAVSQPQRHRQVSSVSPESRSRDRAPIALGSNMSISDAYGRITNDMNTDKTPKTDISVAPSNADIKWVHHNPVPVYTARRIPNYENHGKLDPHYVVKQQIAHPADPSHSKQQTTIPDKKTVPDDSKHIHTKSTDSSTNYRQELQKRSEYCLPPSGYQGSTKLNNQRDPSQNRRLTKEIIFNEHTHGNYGSLNIPSQNLNQTSSSGSWPRDSSSKNTKEPKDTSKNTGQSINSLIEKFEGNKVLDKDHPHYSSHNKLLGKPLTMTSTPVAPRKTISTYQDDESESDNPPPLPPRPADLFQKPDCSSSTVQNTVDPTQETSRLKYESTNNINGVGSHTSSNVHGYSQKQKQYKYRGDGFDRYADQSYSVPSGNYDHAHLASNYKTPQSDNYYGSRMYKQPFSGLSNNYDESQDPHPSSGNEMYRDQLRRASKGKAAIDRLNQLTSQNPQQANGHVPQVSQHGAMAVVKPTVIKQANVAPMRI